MSKIITVPIPKCGRQFGVAAEKDINGKTYYEAWKSLPKGSNGCLGDWKFMGHFPTKAHAGNYLYFEALKERSRKLRAVEYPYTQSRTKDGSYNIPTVDEGLYWEFVAGIITLEEAAQEFCKSGWTDYVDMDYTRKRFNEIDKKFDKLAKVPA